jgi:hypothetical protein
MMATEMNRVSPQKVLPLKGRDGNDLGPECLHRLSQAFEIFWLGEDGEIGIAAKLRRALEHAGLAAHEEAVHAMLRHRKKDFEYRVRDQGCLPG